MRMLIPMRGRSHRCGDCRDRARGVMRFGVPDPGDRLSPWRSDSLGQASWGLVYREMLGRSGE